MKTSKTLPHFKAPAIKFLLLSVLFGVFIFSGCQKNINDVPATANTSSNESDFQIKRYNAAVATDWYRLQLRFLLERNASLANGVYFGYIGIGLYESVRYVNPNSISLSE